jgi:hypothetical protein
LLSSRPGEWGEGKATKGMDAFYHSICRGSPRWVAWSSSLVTKDPVLSRVTLPVSCQLLSMVDMHLSGSSLKKELSGRESQASTKQMGVSLEDTGRGGPVSELLMRVGFCYTC